jgi:hypothetical protein
MILMPRFPLKKRKKASEKICRFHVREFYLNDLHILLQSVFQKVNMFSVFSSAKHENLRKKVERIETQDGKLHFRSIINLVPAGIKEVLSTCFFQMNIEDFTVQKTSEDCLDFIAVCVKRNDSRGTSL